MDRTEREWFLSQLSSAPATNPGSNSFYHGRLVPDPPPPPEVSWGSTRPPRKNVDTPAWLTASEFTDPSQVLEMKVLLLARLLLSSHHTVLYTGAGLSTAAGVQQAARGQTRGSKSKKTEARPSISHLGLALLVHRGLIKEWVQQNHDGLPQKASCPQEVLNEIHGSWFDPSNPVVKYCGTLRDDLHKRMEESSCNSDLVLVLGTSLSGLASDCIPEEAGRRSLAGKSLGTVIINLQQTPMDGMASLRIFGQTDNVIQALLAKLEARFQGSDLPKGLVDHPPASRHALVPYDKDGNRSHTLYTCLDLSPGAAIRLHYDHNCQGADQPRRQHIGSGPGAGDGKVVEFCKRQWAWKLEVEGVPMLLGGWWLEDAKRGGPVTLPLVNRAPVEQQKGKEGEEYRLRCRCRQQ